MKKIIIYLVYFLLTVLIVVGMVSYIFSKKIEDNIEEDNIALKTYWSEIFDLSDVNRTSIEKMISVYPKDSLNDSINLYLKKQKKNRQEFREECTLHYLENEYKINFLFQKLIKSDSIYYSDTIVNNIIMRSSKINKIIEIYNEEAKSYNRYITIIPNQFIAKKNGFKKKELITIKYGGENESPIDTSKKLPKWAEDVDTTSLYTR